MYRVNIADHLDLEILPNMDENKPPVVWIRDNATHQGRHSSLILDLFEIQPLYNELTDAGSVAAKAVTDESRRFRRHIINSLEIEITGERPATRFGIEITDEKLPIVLIYRNLDPDVSPHVITLHLSEIASFCGALEEISDYVKADDAVSLYNEGTLAMQRGDYEQAITYLKEAILLNPQHNLAVFNLAMCYDLLGRFGDALLWYQRAMELAPNDPEPVYNVAEIHFRKKKLPQAQRLCQQALDLFQKQIELFQFMPLPPGEPLSREQFLA